MLTTSGSVAPASVTVHGVSVGVGEETSSTVALSELAGARREADITVSHRCGEDASSCVWFAEASQQASGRCPFAFDAQRSIWIGPIERVAGSERTTVTFRALRGVTQPNVCVYARAAPGP